MKKHFTVTNLHSPKTEKDGNFDLEATYQSNMGKTGGLKRGGTFNKANCTAANISSFSKSRTSLF